MSHGRPSSEFIATNRNTARFFTENRHISWVLLVATATRALARARRFLACFDGPDDALTALFGSQTVAPDAVGVRRLSERIDLEQTFER